MTPETPPKSVIHFETTRKRKASWIQAARPRKLVDWITEHLDRAADKRNIAPPEFYRSQGDR